MSDVKRTCVVTGSRAEYGLLVPVLRRLFDDPRFEVQLVVAGSHMSLLHGETYRQIEEDGFPIAAKVEMVLASDSAAATGKSLGLALIEFTGLFSRLSPDLLVLLGDRYEMLAAAVAATVSSVPIAHIHGGEITQGAFDDAIRHAISKLSHLHFTAAEPFRRRVIQLGESPDRVFTVGAPGMDVIRTLTPVSREELESTLGTRLVNPMILVVYHPVTLPGEDPTTTIRAILSAVGRIGGETVLISLPNADPKFSEVRREILEFAESRTGVAAFPSIGHRAFLSLLALSDLMVGNSSAGIIEAPSLGTVSVNVGIRQEGRPRAESVIACKAELASIINACERGLRRRSTLDWKGVESPYDAGLSCGVQIADVLATTDLGGLLKKEFHELEWSCE